MQRLWQNSISIFVHIFISLHNIYIKLLLYTNSQIRQSSKIRQVFHDRLIFLIKTGFSVRNNLFSSIINLRRSDSYYTIFGYSLLSEIIRLSTNWGITILYNSFNEDHHIYNSRIRRSKSRAPPLSPNILSISR